MTPLEHHCAAFELALKDRSETLSNRNSYGWKGPVGLEESVAILQDDIRMLVWATGRLMNLLRDERATVDGGTEHG